MSEDKCDTCIRWPLICELDGNIRRTCRKENYRLYKKAIYISDFGNMTFKRKKKAEGK